jgi:glutathione synthase
MPETYASADPGYLKAQLSRGGDWVVKPSAGSFGRDVARIGPGPGGEAAIDRMTNHGTRYCLLQRYVGEIEQGEKRTLVAGGQVIGSYLRLPGRDLRANLASGGSPHPTVLTADELDLVGTLAHDLAGRGVGFAAVDTAYPWLIEVNLANPGGLATLESLSGLDPTPAVVGAVTNWLRQCF